MKSLTRLAVTLTAVVAMTGLAPLPAEAASGTPSVASVQWGWWCRLTHLC